MSLPMPFDNPATYPGHTGVDFPQPLGTPIRASGPGVVGLLSRNANGGYITWIDYDGGPGVGYAHQDKHSIARGARVEEGTILGAVGNSGRSTGPHLHIEIADEPGEAKVWVYFDRSRVVGSGAASGGYAEGSAEMRIFQEKLIRMGHDLGPAGADAVNGPRTTAATLFEQGQAEKNGYPGGDVADDGKPGTQTNAYLDWWLEGRHAAPADAGDLRRGSKGAAVGVLQRRLKSNYPLYASHLADDDDFGPATEDVVKEFQRRAGLVDDGVVGPKTRAALGL